MAPADHAHRFKIPDSRDLYAVRLRSTGAECADGDWHWGHGDCAEIQRAPVDEAR
jgi:hypothetical protein